MIPILYDYLISGNGYKVRLLLSQLNIPYEYRAVNIIKGENHEPWFHDKNPMAQIPVLELTDGTCLRESSAILMHVSRGTHLLPPEPMAQTHVLEWLCFEQSNVDQVIARARFRKMFPDVIPTRPEEFVAWHKQGHRALTVMDTHLRSHAFLVGDTYSIADIALYAYTHKAEEGGFELGRYPSVQRWFGRVEAMPGYLSIDTVPVS